MIGLFRKKHLMYINLTFLTSVVSLAIVCIAFSTDKWIDATVNPNDNFNSTFASIVNYGLFKGTLTRRLLITQTEYDIYFTCIWSENACAWSCESDKASRQNQVQQLIDGLTGNFNCPSKGSTSKSRNVQFVKSDDSNDEKIFTNAGLWLSTVIFLSILTIALVASIILTIVHCFVNPIETFFNVYGIYAANGTALVANFLSLLLYGLCYKNYIKKDIAIYDTLVGDFSSETNLGYSYWILIPTCGFHALGIFFIAIREIIVKSERAEKKIDFEMEATATGILF